MANSTYTDIKALVADIRKAYPLKEHLTLRFHDVIMRVMTNDTPLAQELAGYFNPFLTDADHYDILVTAHQCPPPELGYNYVVKQPDPGKIKIKEEYIDVEGGRVVRKRLTGMVFAFSRHEHLAMGPCRENPNQVVNFINNRFISHLLDRGCVLGHASAVSLGGRGIAIAGFSGAGKSTLALHLMSRGVTFVSNDRLMVRNEGAGLVMYGVAKLPRTNPGTLLGNPDLHQVMHAHEKDRFSQMDEHALWQVEHKYDVCIDECFGQGRFALNADMDALVVLHWQRGAGPMSWRFVPHEARAALMPAFMKTEGLFYLPETVQARDNSMEAYLEVLKDCAVIEVSGGVDFDAATELCMTLLGDGNVPPVPSAQE